MSENISFIPSRLKNAASGGHVAGASDIIDDVKNKTQDTINAETDVKFSQMDDEIEALEKQDVVPVDTLPDYSTADPKKIYRVVGETSYIDYMVNAEGTGWKKMAEFSFPGIDNVPTAGSPNLVKSGGVASILQPTSDKFLNVNIKEIYTNDLDAVANVNDIRLQKSGNVWQLFMFAGSTRYYGVTLLEGVEGIHYLTRGNYFMYVYIEGTPAYSLSKVASLNQITTSLHSNPVISEYLQKNTYKNGKLFVLRDFTVSASNPVAINNLEVGKTYRVDVTKDWTVTSGTRKVLFVAQGSVAGIAEPINAPFRPIVFKATAALYNLTLTNEVAQNNDRVDVIVTEINENDSPTSSGAVNHNIMELYSEQDYSNESLNIEFLYVNSVNIQIWIKKSDSTVIAGETFAISSLRDGVFQLTDRLSGKAIYLLIKDWMILNEFGVTAKQISNEMANPVIFSYILILPSENNWKGKTIVWYGTSVPAGGSTPYPNGIATALGANCYNEAVGSSMMTIASNYLNARINLMMTVAEKMAVFNAIWTVAPDDSSYTFNPNNGYVDTDVAGNLETVLYLRKNFLLMSYEVKVISRYLDETGVYLQRILTAVGLWSKYSSDNDFKFRKHPELFVIDHTHNNPIWAIDEDEKTINGYGIDSDDRHSWVGAMNVLISCIFQYLPHARIALISDYDDHTTDWEGGVHTLYMSEATKMVAENWSIPYMPLFPRIQGNMKKTRTQGYWENTGSGYVWHDRGFTFNENAGSLAAALPSGFYVSGRVTQYGQDILSTISAFKSFFNPQQNADGVWMYECPIRYIYMRDGIHPYDESSQGGTNNLHKEYYMEVLNWINQLSPSFWSPNI